VLNGGICLLLDGSRNRAISRPLKELSVVDNYATFWDWETGQILGKITGHRLSIIHQLNSNILITGTRSGTLEIVDLRSPTFPVAQTHGMCELTAITGSGNCVLGGQSDGLVRSLDIRRFDQEANAFRHHNFITGVTQLSDRVIVSMQNGHVAIHDPHQNQGAKNLNLHQPINCMYGDGHSIAYLGLDTGEIASINIECETTVRRNLANCHSAIASMNYRQDLLTVGCADGSIHYQPPGRERWESIYEGRRKMIWQIQRDASRLISSSLDGKFVIHDFGPTTYYGGD
jgi:WD40 repeat protein